jgi:hypothetical protein
MINYTIPEHPIKYKGRIYRSKLEARWAAFFDIVGWGYEYEPCNFKGWIPDFILYSNSKYGKYPHCNIYVEVKPIKTFNEDLFFNYRSLFPVGVFMMLGDGLTKDEFGMPGIGWFVGVDNCLTCHTAGQELDFSCNEVYTACLKKDGGGYGISSGLEEGCGAWFDLINKNVDSDTFIDKDEADKLWVNAANKIMWKGELYKKA